MVKSVHYDGGPAIAGFSFAHLCCMAFPVALQVIPVGKTKIELFVPDEEAIKKAYQENKIAFPYWSKIWPSAIALSEFILQHPNYIKNKNLLELGAGLGLPSITAARFARSVLCTDNVGEASSITKQSAQHNGLTNFKTAVMDWNNLPDDVKADVLLLSDVNYEPAIFDSLLRVVKDFLLKGTTILISTPQRLMAKDFIAPLLQYAIYKTEMTVNQNKGETAIAALVLEQEKS